VAVSLPAAALMNEIQVSTTEKKNKRTRENVIMSLTFE
jgi:hypothetical protein